MRLPFKLIDLTHGLNPNICGNTGIGGCGFKHTTKRDYNSFEGDIKFKVQEITMHAGIGTHIDAPSHCYADGLDIASIPLEDLVAPVVVIDVSKKSHERYSVSVADILEFEKTHGKISDGSLVLIYTGWEKYWHDPKQYLNNMLFPSTSKEAAELLLERNIVGLGMDTISPDRPEDDFHVHRILLGANKYIVENVANIKNLPATGAYTFCLPIKSEGGTEAPVRLIGVSL